MNAKQKLILAVCFLAPPVLGLLVIAFVLSGFSRFEATALVLLIAVVAQLFAVLLLQTGLLEVEK